MDEPSEHQGADIHEVGGWIIGFGQLVEPCSENLERSLGERVDQPRLVNFLEAQDRLRGGPAEELCDPSYTAYLAGFPPMGLAEHQEFSASFYAAIPDLRHEIEDVIAEADHVAVRFRLRGTNSGSFMGNPPSGQAIDIGGLVLMRIESEKVSDLRGEFDQLGLMEQIGALPRQLQTTREPAK